MVRWVQFAPNVRPAAQAPVRNTQYLHFGVHITVHRWRAAVFAKQSEMLRGDRRSAVTPGGSFRPGDVSRIVCQPSPIPLKST
jgi:hypothetical protein